MTSKSKKPGKQADLKLGETPRGDPKPKAGKLATPSNSSKTTLASKGKMPARDASRQDYGKQIILLKRNMHELLREISHCVRRGELDKAVLKCCKVAEQRSHMMAAVTKYTEQLAQPALQDKPVNHRSRTGSKAKVKRETSVMDVAWKERNKR